MKLTLTILLEKLEEGNYAMIPRPASNKDISLCIEDLSTLELETLPDDYVRFLRLCNGFAWNGIEFYGSDRVTDIETNFTLMDIVSITDNMVDIYEMYECLFLGQSDEDIFCFNSESQKYEILDRTGLDVMESFDSFEELFVDTVGCRFRGVLSFVEESKKNN